MRAIGSKFCRIAIWDCFMGRHIFFSIGQIKVVRELGENRPMVQFDTTPTQSYAESWPVPDLQCGAKIKGGKK